MDERRFEAARCGLGATGSGRRGVLKALAVSGIVAGVRGVTGGPAAAKTKKPKGPCSDKCGSACDKRTAAIFCIPGNTDCACIRSISGKIHCANAGGDPCPPTGSSDQCHRDADCGPDAICVKTAGGLCCSQEGKAQVNMCLPLCTAASVGLKSNRETGSLIDDVRQRLVRR